jgi:uncharacterized protein (DUF1499 family)
MNFLARSTALSRAGATLTILGCALLVSACAAPSSANSGTEPSATDLNCTLPTNCVNSFSASGPAPLRFEGSPEQAMAALKATLAGFPEAKVVSADAVALSAIFTTSAGFQDRVDFIIDATRQRIDYRSQSRFGLYDFGKNHSRMAALVERFEQNQRR